MKSWLTSSVEDRKSFSSRDDMGATTGISGKSVTALGASSLVMLDRKLGTSAARGFVENQN